RLRGGRRLRRAALLALRPALAQQILELVHELIDVLERAIDRGEAHVGDGVELVERLHHRLADHRARDLALGAVEEAALDAVDVLLDLLDADRALLARLGEAGDDLHAVEGLAPAVLLDHRRQVLLDALVGREAAAALLALATPPDDVAVL